MFELHLKHLQALLARENNKQQAEIVSLAIFFQVRAHVQLTLIQPELLIELKGLSGKG